MKLSPNIETLSLWLQMEVNKHKYAHKYADISAIIRIHNGRITLIEKTVAEKEKPTEIIGVSHERKY